MPAPPHLAPDVSTPAPSGPASAPIGSAGRSARRIGLVGLIAVLALAAFLRRATFHMPHFRGDQHHYVGLAYKLVTHGVGDYNLRGLDLRSVPGKPGLLVFVDAPGRGPLVDAMVRGGDTYYDVPLFQTPYGFPILLALSHALSGEAAFGCLFVNEAAVLRNAPPGAGIGNFRFPPGVERHQRWSVSLPFAASLLLVALTYALALRWFERPLVALIACLLVAVSPIDLLTSQKIWADDVTAVFTLAAVLLFCVAKERRSGWVALAAGLACGFGIVTKHTAGFASLALGAWYVGSFGRELAHAAAWRRIALDRVLWGFALGTLLVSGHWFWLMTTTYGNPIYLPSQAVPVESEWMRMVTGRPGYLYLLGIPYQNPFFALAWLAPLALLLTPARRAPLALGLSWIGVYLVVFATILHDGSREHRYMLPTYAAYAALSAYVGVALHGALARRVPPWIAGALLALALGASAFWSARIGLEAVDHGVGLIRQPW